MIIDNRQYTSSIMDILQDLKAELIQKDIDLLQDIKDGPDNIMITCPYHNEGHERKPSMGVKKDSGICHCFSCGKVVTLQDLVSHCFNQSNYGNSWLSEHYDYIILEQTKNVFDELSKKYSKEQDRQLLLKSKRRHAKDDIGYESDLRFVSEEELDSYRWTHPYWEKRGIVNEHILEYFDLGYDREKKMITMPVRDIKGRCEFVAKRSVNTKFFQYPPGVSKPLYGLYELYQTGLMGSCYRDTDIKKLFICESMIDCILLWQAGYYAVALNGLGNNRQFKQLNDLPISHFILATDNDEAGQSARVRIKKNVTRFFTEIKFPKGIKDIGECTREQIENILVWEVF